MIYVEKYNPRETTQGKKTRVIKQELMQPGRVISALDLW